MSCDEILAEVTAFSLEREGPGLDELPPALREHLDRCPGCREEAEALAGLWSRLALLEAEPPEAELRERFDVVLAAYQEGLRAAQEGLTAAQTGTAATSPSPAPEASRARSERSETTPWWRRWLAPGPGPQLAYGALALVLGVGLGALVFGRVGPGGGGGEVRELRGEVRALHELVALSLLEDPSASERLQGVSFGARMERPDRDVVSALVSAATSDPSVNVRLAAIEALAPRAAEPPVFDRLVAALPEQDSPLVQVALVDLLLESDGETARRAALRLAGDDSTHPDVRRHVRQRLGSLL